MEKKDQDVYKFTWRDKLMEWTSRKLFLIVAVELFIAWIIKIYIRMIMAMPEPQIDQFVGSSVIVILLSMMVTLIAAYAQLNINQKIKLNGLEVSSETGDESRERDGYIHNKPPTTPTYPKSPSPITPPPSTTIPK